MEPIPQEWIKKYVDTLLVLAAKMPVEGVMRAAMLLRAEHAMDLVKAWRDRDKTP